MIGRTLSHYVIESALGEGGMGAVYLARDERLGRRVAIKVLAGDSASDPELGARLLREARAASALNHPHIVTVHEIGHADGLDFIVLEHVEGRRLSDEIPEGGMPVARAVDLARQIAGGVAAAHAAHVVHRDLKPSNVIVTAGGSAKVLDFGLARIVTPRERLEAAPTRTAATAPLTTAGTILGTVGYMSPEQIEGKTVDTPSDVFSLGIVVYEMLAGRRPFTGDSDWAVMTATVEGAAPPIGSLRRDVPPALARIVSRALATRPADRPTAAEVERELSVISTPAAAPASRSPARAMAAAAMVGVIALAAVAWLLWHQARLRWAGEVAPVQMTKQVAEDDVVGAWQIGQRALAIAPRDSRVRQAIINLSATISNIRSEPSGARVEINNYLGTVDHWVALGTTPIDSVPIPLAMMRWRLTKPGFDTLEVGQAIDLLEFRLAPQGNAPRGMVLVPHGTLELESTRGTVELPDFWLDRYEVTNREYKAFVDAGGYAKREYWKEPFVKDGRVLSWDQAMAELRDPTGRPGPATWELGSYPEGQADLPVGGVSWYEAAAYASWAHKQLPTAYHWYRASQSNGVFSDIVTLSNFSGRGPVAVSRSGGLGPFGTYGMAGNVKEWCWNATRGDRRFVLGGGWDELSYMYRDDDAQPPIERRPTFGLRCMTQAAPLAPALTAAIVGFERDPSTLKPVSDEVYRAYAHLYDYDALPLDARVESVDDANPAWRMERVSVRAQYGSDRLPLCIYLPRTGKPPFQAVVYFPGSNAVSTSSSQNLSLRMSDFVIRSGRVLVYPIYQGTYERRRPGPRTSAQFREIMIDRGMDLRRAVDYLESRRDIDRSRIAYMGTSLGAQLGPVYLAIEPRLKTGVLFSGGFETWEIPPESDPVNFAPRVKQPVLMVNGRQDFDLPYATAQVPMFNALGSAPEDKKHVVFEGGHIPPHPQEAIRVMLDWLDARLGPVR